MQRLLRISLVISLLTPAFSLSAVMAQNVSGNSANKVATTASEAETETEVHKSTLAERLSAHKSQFNLKLTRTEQDRIKTRCKAAQGLTSSLSGRIKGIETSRNAVYSNITKRLASLQTKLQEKDINTTELQGQIAELRIKIDTFKTDLTGYKQAVADLSEMDCNADPVTFKSTLEAARAARKKVAADIADIRLYVTDTIKPTLVKIRISLEANKQKAED